MYYIVSIVYHWGGTRIDGDAAVTNSATHISS